MDGQVLGFTLIVSVLTGLAFALLPVLQSKQDLVTALHDGCTRSASGIRGRKLRSALVVAQVAVSLVLLSCAGLMLRSVYKLQTVDPGFDPENVLTLLLDLNWSKYDENEKIVGFHQALLGELQRHPGVLAAAVARTFPLSQSGPANLGFQIEGRKTDDGETKPLLDFRVASPEYFRTMGIPLLAGRTFNQGDQKESPGVVIINESMARHHFPDQEPLGQRISADQGESWWEIIGVVGDVKQYGLDSDATDEVYVSHTQNSIRRANLLVRTREDPREMVAQIREAVYRLDLDQPVAYVRTLEQIKDDSIASPRLTATLLGLFAVVALLITAAGISGVMALSVGQRTHEIGIRMALGASGSVVVGMVLRRGMTLVAAGLAVGLVGAMVLSQLMSSLLFGVEPTDPFTYVAVAAVLVSTTALACLVPARRATSIDPMAALRTN